MSTLSAESILERLLSGSRPTVAEAAELVARGDLISLGMVVGELRRRSAAAGTVSFTLDRTVDLGQACDSGCPYCAGTTPPAAPGAGAEPARERAAQAAGAPGLRQVVLQGGHRTDLPLSFYTGLLAELRHANPGVARVAFSPSEVLTWAQAANHPAAAVLAELQAAGLDAMLAAGGEALPARRPEHRRLLAGPWPEWEAVIAAAGELGIPVIAPVPFGLGESPRERAEYLLRLQRLQEQTGAIAALLPFAPAVAPPQPGEGDELRLADAGDLAPAASPAPAELMATGHEYLRMVALCRLLVPGVAHVSASPMTQGAKVAQVALACGADDFGGTQEQFELAELAAGRVGPMTAPEFARLIRDAGFRPALRDAGFRTVGEFGE